MRPKKAYSEGPYASTKTGGTTPWLGQATTTDTVARRGSGHQTEGRDAAAALESQRDSIGNTTPVRLRVNRLQAESIELLAVVTSIDANSLRLHAEAVEARRLVERTRGSVGGIYGQP